MRYLIVTPDCLYAHHLASLARAQGDIADCRTTGGMVPCTRRYLLEGGVDGVVLDLSGVGVMVATREVRAWRRTLGETIRLMVVTRRDCWQDVVRYVQAGADGCHDRGEDARALPARLSAMVRRGQGGISDEIALGQFCIDLRRGTLIVGGERVRLTVMEFRVLAVLVRHRGRVLARNDILLRLYGEVPGDGGGHSLDVILGRLRRKMSAVLPEAAGWIRTHRGMGFVFEQPAADPGPHQARRTTGPGVCRGARRRMNALRAGWCWPGQGH